MTRTFLNSVEFLVVATAQIFSDKLHKSKVSHAEFNARCDWLLATASIDHTVKLWDLRNIKDKSSFLHELPHEKAVNSGETPGRSMRSPRPPTVVRQAETVVCAVQRQSVHGRVSCSLTAYFNPVDCSKLLTTDQYDQIRVYSSSDWSKPQHIIRHPHRQFQHLTPIKVGSSALVETLLTMFSLCDLLSYFLCIYLKT